jgi:hypothetical protein
VWEKKIERFKCGGVLEFRMGLKEILRFLVEFRAFLLIFELVRVDGKF